MSHSPSVAGARSLVGARVPSRPFLIDRDRIRDLSPDVLDDQGRLKVLPAAFWAGTTAEERALFGLRHAIYSFPTVELVDRLDEIIGEQVAIEIGAGHGVLADALAIPGTDNRMQRYKPWKTLIEMQGQPTVTYGPNVVELHASRAVRHYQAQVAIGCWVTQKYDPRRPHVDSLLNGVDEEDIIQRCDRYVLIGNTEVHRQKVIWSRPHTIEHPPYLYSRAINGTPEFLAVFSGGRRR